jgi:hypothetical protein
MIDANRLFGLFDDGDIPEEVKADSLGLSKETKESPTWKINMFRKIISNHINFQEKVTSFFKEKNKDWDDEIGKDHADLVVYNRGWYYIKDVDLNDKYYVYELIIQDPYELSYCLQLTLKYFENKEEYKKCAHIFKIINFLEEAFQDHLE